MIDLHTHSTYSDGTFTPTEILHLAEQIGLSAVALSDHNTVAGLPEFMAVAQNHSLEAVAGVEFSTEYEGTELHILALFLSEKHYDTVTDVLNEMLQRKEQSNKDLIQTLSHHGISLDYDAIKAGTPGGLVNRAVIAAEMTRLGYTQSIKQAFSQWLSEKHGHYKPPRRLDCFEAIRFIRSLDCVSVLAHPFLNLDAPSLRCFLEQAVKTGLNAMETRYPLFDAETSWLAQQIADEFGLRESGGSDFHGANKSDIQLGTGRGDLLVPRYFLTNLKSVKHHLKPSEKI